MARSIGEPMQVRPTEWQGVYSDGSWLLTRNLNPGVSVYGESLHLEGGVEYRRWDVNRSKRAAYLKCGGRVWPYDGATSVLYLGGAHGTTGCQLPALGRPGPTPPRHTSARALPDLIN